MTTEPNHGDVMWVVYSVIRVSWDDGNEPELTMNQLVMQVGHLPVQRAMRSYLRSHSFISREQLTVPVVRSAIGTMLKEFTNEPICSDVIRMAVTRRRALDRVMRTITP